MCAGVGCTLSLNCYQSIYSPCERTWFVHHSDEDECTSEGFCNWMDCNAANLTSEDCITACESRNTSFCAYCNQGFYFTNTTDLLDQSCVDIPVSIPDITTCQNTAACLLPDKTIVMGLTQSQCQMLGQCSYNCGIQCQTEAGCIPSGEKIVDKLLIFSIGYCTDNSLAGGVCVFDLNWDGSGVSCAEGDINQFGCISSNTYRFY